MVTSPPLITEQPGFPGFQEEVIASLNALANDTIPEFNVAIASIDEAIQYVWADATARNAQTGMVEGEKGLQNDTKGVYWYESSTWVLKYIQNEGDTGKFDVITNKDGTGAPSFTYGLSVPNGQGIDFSAIEGSGAASSILDDYEEGEFTPTVIGTTTAGVGTYTAQVGRYTKVGNFVKFQLYVDITAHTGSGDLRLESLPYATSSTTNNYASVSIGYVNNLTFTGVALSAYCSRSATDIVIRQYTSNAATSAVPLDTAFGMMIAGSYEI